MTKHEQVMSAINSGMRFSWNLDGIQPFQPQGRVIHTLDSATEGSIGWILQEFAKKAIYNDNINISFEPTPNGLNVWYEN